MLAARPRAFSFVFGVPDEALLRRVPRRGIRTIGTATTPDEAVALDAAGVDAIVASGAEAGGHRGAFLAAAEDSLVGTLSLVRTAAREVRAPVIAAGGIADAHGVVAALALGAEGVQVGSAFLATEESGTTPEHRAALLGGAARRTTLTRAYSGRLARGIPNRLVDELTDPEPYPYQGHLLRPVLAKAREQGRTDVVALWAGQGASLLRDRHAAELYAALVDGADQLLAGGPGERDVRDAARRGRGLDRVVLLDPLQSVPQPYAAAEQDRDHDDVRVVDEPGGEEVADDAGTSTDTDVQAARGLAGRLQGLGRRGVEEVERRPALHLDRRARVVREDEHRGVERRVGTPPRPSSPGPRAIRDGRTCRRP